MWEVEGQSIRLGCYAFKPFQAASQVSLNQRDGFRAKRANHQRMAEWIPPGTRDSHPHISLQPRRRGDRTNEASPLPSVVICIIDDPNIRATFAGAAPGFGTCFFAGNELVRIGRDWGKGGNLPRAH